MRRGPFRVGDRVQLTDPKGKLFTITLTEDGTFNTHKSAFKHRDLLGKPEGTVLETAEGVRYLCLRPLLSDYVLSMPRGAAVIYPKDAALIVQYADIFPGARVVEAGVGSGALSLSLISAIGDTGKLLSVERREDFAEIAKANVDLWFGGRPKSWQVAVGDLNQVLPARCEPHSVDRVILDMLAPWENLEEVAQALVPGGVLLCYVATVTQLSRLVEDLRATGRFTTPHAWETMSRDWHLEGLAVRPEHRMVGHTGFLLTCRTMASGVSPLEKKKRPAKAAEGLAGQWDDTDSWSDTEIGLRPVSEKKLRRVRRDVTAKANHWLGETTDGSEA
ncbi:SAM-dependent methyltransferase [Boudabousia tangfeifanii]|uniref:tRNA (adenine(58)-N(1))-methyltransferase TrmI n=1 Tax=Boudabousia tangfeifanii TaxID=1912795 RepID=A0A1D9MME6_9ACTO|nr:SAM-dependent methyltransferase [Boudabousia tangfeifanii]